MSREHNFWLSVWGCSLRTEMSWTDNFLLGRDTLGLALWFFRELKNSLTTSTRKGSSLDNRKSMVWTGKFFDDLLSKQSKTNAKFYSPSFGSTDSYWESIYKSVVFTLWLHATLLTVLLNSDIFLSPALATAYLLIRFSRISRLVSELLRWRLWNLLIARVNKRDLDSRQTLLIVQRLMSGCSGLSQKLKIATLGTGFATTLTRPRWNIGPLYVIISRMSCVFIKSEK